MTKTILLIALVVLPICGQDPYNEKPSYGRSRDFGMRHVKLELSFDLPMRRLMGVATLRMASLGDGLHEVCLDSAQLAINTVTIEGRQLEFHTADDKLYVALDRQYPAGVPFDLVIQYHAQPKRGLFFVMPDGNHPNRPKQIWAQGDTAGGNNRFWFPGYDFPNDKATTEMLVTVPSGWETVSNGSLLSVTENRSADTRTFHWLQDKPMSSYLISLVAGEFEKHEDKWKVPVAYYVPRGRGSAVPRTFGRTTQMLDFFAANIAPYPWAKYVQTAVDTFNGGMENTSATTLGATTLLDAYQFEDDRPATDANIAHEMAHQWFGDLVTCADWRHAWLNEGFATYFEALWEEHVEGRDYFDWIEDRAGRNIASRKSGGSVVPRDGSSDYPSIDAKGGWILQMVRGQLGDAKFWKAIQHYTRKFSFRNATTSDFVEAISESTGQDLEWLFDQYVYRPGNPSFDVSWEYDAAKHGVHVAVKQVEDGSTAPFHLPVEFELLGDDLPQTFRAWVDKPSNDFFFAVAGRPYTVLFDPRNIILKSITFRKPASEWVWQMEKAPRALNRSEAALALSSFSTPEALAALLRSAASDKFFGTRLASIGSLSRIATEDIREPMLNLLTDKDLRIRKAAASALGGLRKDDDCVARLLDLARSDPSYSVRQSALSAVIRLKPDHLIELVTPFLEMDSPGQRMKPMAMSALAKLGDESIVPKFLDLSHDSNDRVRRTALQTFAYVGKGQQIVTDRLLESLGDPEKVERLTAIEVLSQRKDAAAIEPLQHLLNTESLPGVVLAARIALESMRTLKK
jgi:aminopeptidase N